MSWADQPGDPGAAYARSLLASHGIDAEVPEPARPRSIAADWATSGAMALTGAADGPPRLVDGAPATTARGAFLALAALAETAGLDPSRLPDHRALAERAAVMGLRRNGRISVGGASRLLDAADGVISVTLSRPGDVNLLPALLGRDDIGEDHWRFLADRVSATAAAEVVERATLLGLAAGVVDRSLPTPDPVERPLHRPARITSPLTVVDLSALWAGPLCGHLLGLLGARVISLESTTRPDPTRTVSPPFHQLLRGECEAVSLDITTADGVTMLAELVSTADVVIESTRPRALHQLGIYPAEIVAASKVCSWVSITAYGRASNRIGYGDDVAASAGLLGVGPDPVFAGDALADPLTGVHAAVAALAGVLTGRCAVLDIAMYDVARAARTPAPHAEVLRRGDRWYVDDGRELVAVRTPAVRGAA